MLTHTHPAPARERLESGDSLDDLLRSWAGGGGPADEASAPCLLCDGETFTVRRRSGATAVVCRSCGTSLEDDVAPAATVERHPPARTWRSDVMRVA